MGSGCGRAHHAPCRAATRAHRKLIEDAPKLNDGALYRFDSCSPRLQVGRIGRRQRERLRLHLHLRDRLPRYLNDEVVRRPHRSHARAALHAVARSPCGLYTIVRLSLIHI